MSNVPGCQQASKPVDNVIGSPAEAEAWFDDISGATGIGFQHVSGHQDRFYLPEIMGGGVGLLDYDQDGYLDVYLVQSGSLNLSAAEESEKLVNRLYRNLGDGTFQDVTDRAHVGDSGYGMGCACGDCDADGDVDIYVTNVGPNVLYRNNADGTFTDVTAAAGVGEGSWSTSASFLDYDRDGHLDLFVANYVVWNAESEKTCVFLGQPDYCSPKNYLAAQDTLYRGQGDGTFENATSTSGIDQALGNGLGVACGDFNADGFTDIYVANDATMNQLWINRGDGRFTDEGLISGSALNIEGIAEAGMGVAAVDIENDGDLDLFVSHLRRETNTLYLNHDADFEDATAMRGLASPSVGLTGFGLGFADFDHDGILDLYVVNGRVERAKPQHDPLDSYAEPNQVFRGKQAGYFGESKTRGGTSKPLLGNSRGAAFGDLDNDGDIDIVVANREGAPFVLRNQVGSRGNGIQFAVLDRRGILDIGARVKIVAGKLAQWRSVQPGYSYCSSNDPRIHFGLAAATRVDLAVVHWSSGEQESWGPLAAGELYELRQGEGRTR